MRWGFVFNSVFLLFCSNLSATEKCPDYLLGLANSEISRFGAFSPKTHLQLMANLMLDYVPKDEVNQIQIAIPAFLEFNPDQQEQFGDGQKNANAHFGSLKTSPFVAILTRYPEGIDADLAIILSKDLPNYDQIQELEVFILGQTLNVKLDENSMFRILLDPKQLKWEQLTQTEAVYFRPKGWNDWFAVQFPNAYLSIDDLIKNIAASSKKLPTGESIVDPLNLKGSSNFLKDLRFNDAAKNLDFVLARTERSERLHGIYIPKNSAPIITSTGGVWTRYRLGEPFKNIYLVKDPRVLDLEEQEGGVSGTGPHMIGATAEIILNSVGTEELMTLYGINSPSIAPHGGQLAWGFTHQWIGTWLKPGDAFVAPNGTYHWHMNHLTQSLAAQVFTPPQIPSSLNHFGFPKEPK